MSDDTEKEPPVVGYEALSEVLDSVVVDLELGNDLEPDHRHALHQAIRALRNSVSIAWHSAEVSRVLDQGLAYMDDMDKRHAEAMTTSSKVNTALRVQLRQRERALLSERQKRTTAEDDINRYKNIARVAVEERNSAQHELHKRHLQDGLNAMRPWVD